MTRVEHWEAIDLFAGGGGWSLACRELGIADLGIELDKDACATRKAAGLATVQGDVAVLDPRDFGPVEGLIASPPCQAWSTAGKRDGEVDKPNVYRLAEAWAAGDDVAVSDFPWVDDRSPLVCEPVRWAKALQPTWMAFEQVPPVLELWRHFADYFRQWGYSVWAGVISAERFGVPQTRKRAILLAHRDRPVAPPAPTHQEYRPGEPARHEVTLLGEVLPWVSMAEALGWDESWATGHQTVRGAGSTERHGDRPLRQATEPSHMLTSKVRSWTVERPAPTIVTTRRSEDGLLVGRQLPEGEGRNVGGHDWKDGDPKLRAGNQENAAVRSADEPAPTVAYGNNAAAHEWVYDRRQDDGKTPTPLRPRQADEPAPTVSANTASRDRWRRDEQGQQPQNAVRVSLEEASILQSFPPDFPWQGSRSACFLQCGNAIPPGLAEAVLGSVVEPVSKAKAA